MSSNGNGHVKYLKPVFNPTKDMSHLRPWQRWLYWCAFVPLLRLGFRLGLPVLIDKNGIRLEVLSVAETDALASAMVASIGGDAFYVPNVPKNLMLPKSNVVFGGNRAPYSEVARLYEEAGAREDVMFVCPTTHELCVQRTKHESIPRQQVEQLYQKVKSAVAS